MLIQEKYFKNMDDGMICTISLLVYLILKMILIKSSLRSYDCTIYVMFRCPSYKFIMMVYNYDIDLIAHVLKEELDIPFKGEDIIINIG
ncbi:hypothetical protein [Clostridium senegalense]|uniref:hypothetical protein n=1 Tax=Clostridium senegalense TaxID=1465809 RepID=UPI0012DBD18A|nr:hypothetical protein [Clostridium senegalense]